VKIINTPYENSAEFSRFPFCGDSSMMSSDKATMPSNFVVDASLMIPGGDSVYLSSAYIGDHIASIAIATVNEPVLVGSVPIDTYFDTLTIQLTPLVSGASGYVVIRDIRKETDKLKYVFNSTDNTRFLPSVVHASRPTPIPFLYNKVKSTILDGNVFIEGKGDLTVQADDSTSEIILSVESNSSNYLGECDAGSNEEASVPIVSLNGVRPNSEGVLSIRIPAYSQDEEE